MGYLTLHLLYNCTFGLYAIVPLKTNVNMPVITYQENFHHRAMMFLHLGRNASTFIAAPTVMSKKKTSRLQVSLSKDQHWIQHCSLCFIWFINTHFIPPKQSQSQIKKYCTVFASAWNVSENLHKLKIIRTSEADKLKHHLIHLCSTNHHHDQLPPFSTFRRGSKILMQVTVLVLSFNCLGFRVHVSPVNNKAVQYYNYIAQTC